MGWKTESREGLQLTVLALPDHIKSQLIRRKALTRVSVTGQIVERSSALEWLAGARVWLPVSVPAAGGADSGRRLPGPGGRSEPGDTGSKRPDNER